MSSCEMGGLDYRQAVAVNMRAEAELLLIRAEIIEEEVRIALGAQVEEAEA